MRRSTETLHKDVEGRVDWRAAFSSAECYRDLLRRIYRVQAPADRAIEHHLSEPPDWLASRRRAGRLELDLSCVLAKGDTTKPDDAAGSGAVPRQETHADFSWVENAEHAAGVLYVLEGSTMGSRYLARSLEKSLGVCPGAGGDYFSAYGSETESRWSATKAWLDEEFAAETQRAPVEHAARRTFEIYGQHVGGAE
ncbi:biliverdin-producing heme oxygenase [Pseudobythopirellula maris]|uniref:biliverdin-producing heme oxygenase n=1 Tax=Pseudobythopirellula maris TaxID=2527991 RepID=UPI0018D2EA6D|nr:biliverdin-producing heme oxygenase [Pseudobythopirellula maris]